MLQRNVSLEKTFHIFTTTAFRETWEFRLGWDVSPGPADMRPRMLVKMAFGDLLIHLELRIPTFALHDSLVEMLRVRNGNRVVRSWTGLPV